MATAAEETRNPQRDVPRGILGSLIICTLLYVAVSIVVTGMQKYSELSVVTPFHGRRPGPGTLGRVSATPKTERTGVIGLPSQRTVRGRTESAGLERGGYWRRLAPLLALLVAVTHLPSFLRPVWNPDEGFLATQARMLAAGAELYDTVVDRKPPLLPWLYQGTFAVFGDDSLWPLRILALVAHLATALLLASIARRRWNDRAGVAAGAAYALLSIGLAPEDTQAASFGVFMLPWTAAAFWAGDRRRWLLAGLCVAGAALTKQTGAAVLLPLVWLAWSDGCDGRATRRAYARLALGFAVPVAAVAFGLGAEWFFFWTVTGSGTYLSAAGAWGVALGRALGNAGVLAVAAAGVVLPVCCLLARRRAFADTGLWLWLAASAAAVVTGFQFYGHYYLQLLPPLVLLGVAALRQLPRWWRPAAAWTALASAGFLAWGLAFAPRTELDHARAVAAALRAHTSAGDTVLVWGMHPEDYWLADRAPAGRYLTAGFLTNFSGGRGGVRVGERYAVPSGWQTFRREFAARPPALVVDDSRGAPYGVDRMPTLRALLAEGYERVGTVDGAVLYAPRQRWAGPARSARSSAALSSTAGRAC